MKTLLLLMTLTLSAFSQVKINAGGPRVVVGTDTFLSDQYWVGGVPFTYAVPATLPKIYETVRYGISFSYNVPFKVGPAKVKLHFIEASPSITTVGQRIFSVTVNNVLVVDRLDIVKEVGTGVPVTREFDVVSTGTIAIRFDTLVRNAVVSAIEVTEIVVPPPVPITATQKVESFVLNATTRVFTPTFLVRAGTCLTVVKNGMTLSEGPDYVFTGDSISFTDGALPIAEDYIQLRYETLSTTPRQTGEVGPYNGSCGVQTRI